VSQSGGIDTLKKAMPNTPLLAFRGIGTFDIHISKVMAVFSNPEVAPSWVDLMRSMSVAYAPGTFSASAAQQRPPVQGKGTTAARFSTSDYAYQYYDLPWPVADRDFVFERSWHVDADMRQVALEYVSVSESKGEGKEQGGVEGGSTFAALFPEHALQRPAGTIRGESPLTKWVFRCVARGADSCARTYVDVQILVDNKGSIPAAVVNLIQRSWPHKTLSGLLKLAMAAPDGSTVHHQGVLDAGIHTW
jgi:hypothetical protein